MHHVVERFFHPGLFFKFNDLWCKSLKSTGVNPVAYNIVDDIRIRQLFLSRS